MKRILSILTLFGLATLLLWPQTIVVVKKKAAVGGGPVTYQTHTEIIDTDRDNSVTVTVPSGLTTGNVWLITAAVDTDGTAFTFNTPSGFTPIGSQFTANQGWPKGALFYKVAGSSESSATLTYSGADWDIVVYSVRISGANASPVDAVSAPNTPAGGDVTTGAPGITIASDNSLAFALLMIDSVASITQPSGATLMDSRLGGYPSCALAYQAVNAGAYSPGDWAHSSNNGRVAITFSLKP